MARGNAVRKRCTAIAIAASLSLSASGGCRSLLPPAGAYEYFGAPALDDAWSHKIRGWQARELTGMPEIEAAEPAPPGTSAGLEHPGLERGKVGDLRAKYDSFRTERRRDLAREVAEWIQTEARVHYVADGPVDHWATFAETFVTNGDDCDGLELLTFHFLRELGFSREEVFRAIVVRRTDGQHHMVTLWFEDPDDPWVIDPTGAMTTGMPRMSDVPGWVPLKVFSDSRDFTVRERMLLTAAAH
jgi:hypothetical protein